MYEVRRVTNKVIELAENGVLSWQDLAIMCLNFMSEDDVVDMAECEGLVDDDEEEEED